MDRQRQRILMNWLRQRSALAGRWPALTILCGAISGALLIAQAYLLATLLHGVISSTLRQTEIRHTLALLLAVVAGRALCALLREQCAFACGAAVRRAVRKELLDTLASRGPAYLQRKPAGSWASLLQEQVENLQDFYARYLPQTRLSVVQPLLILVAVFPVNWAAGLILLITAPLIPLFMILTGLGAADASRRNFESLRRLSGYFLDRLRGLATLRLYHRTEAERDTLRQASEEFRERTMEVLRMAFLSSAVLEFFASVAIALIAVYFGFNYLEHLPFGDYGSKATLFTGLFVLLLAPDFYMPLRELGSHYHAKAQAIGAAESIEAFLAEPILPLPGGQIRAELDSPFTIEARDLVVLSPEGDPLVGPLTFTLNHGSQNLLIGQTGSGKSSLLNALLGFLPYQGSLSVAGIEFRELDMGHWRSQLGWLGQNPKLVHGTLRDNLTMGRHIEDAQLEEAMRQAHAEEILAAKGWEHPIGDGASGLSVGQAQRVALARALLGPARLWLLDEPTASLDRHNEQRILAALQPRLEGKTTLMVTHRLDELANADQLLLLEHGKLLACGAPEHFTGHDSPLMALLAQPGTLQEPKHA